MPASCARPLQPEPNTASGGYTVVTFLSHDATLGGF
jgi:hypothetical protein